MARNMLHNGMYADQQLPRKPITITIGEQYNEYIEMLDDYYRYLKQGGPFDGGVIHLRNQLIEKRRLLEERLAREQKVKQKKDSEELQRAINSNIYFPQDVKPDVDLDTGYDYSTPQAFFDDRAVIGTYDNHKQTFRGPYPHYDTALKAGTPTKEVMDGNDPNAIQEVEVPADEYSEQGEDQKVLDLKDAPAVTTINNNNNTPVVTVNPDTLETKPKGNFVQVEGKAPVPLDTNGNRIGGNKDTAINTTETPQESFVQVEGQPKVVLDNQGNRATNTKKTGLVVGAQNTSNKPNQKEAQTIVGGDTISNALATKKENTPNKTTTTTTTTPKSTVNNTTNNKTTTSKQTTNEANNSKVTKSNNIRNPNTLSTEQLQRNKDRENNLKNYRAISEANSTSVPNLGWQNKIRALGTPEQLRAQPQVLPTQRSQFTPYQYNSRWAPNSASVQNGLQDTILRANQGQWDRDRLAKALSIWDRNYAEQFMGGY